MDNKNRYIRILPHLLFWGAFLLIFSMQNENADINDYIKISILLIIVATIVYINLYVLFPLYFYKKKFIQYALTLAPLILLFSFVINYSLSGRLKLDFSLFQNILSISIFIIITGGFNFYTENKRQQLKINSLKNIQLNNELSLLKSQVNPHFLFNSLNNLYGLVLKNKNEIAAQNILSLSELMRYILESSTKKEVPITEEINFIKNYLSLEKIRLDKELDIKFETSISNNHILIPPLLLIPMIENAFKHGVEHHTQEGFAHFSLSLQENELFFEATNSISKLKTEEKQKSGKGLINLQKRLHILYPNKHSLNVDKKDHLYSIVLNIEL